MAESVDITTLGLVLQQAIAPHEQRRVASLANKRMPCRATRYDGDLATNIAIQRPPAPGAYVGVCVGGWNVPLIGDGTKVGCMCFFSGDGGRTARRWGQAQVLDTIHWNPSVAGAQLAETDLMDLIFEEGMVG